MKRNMLKRSLVCTVILLFIGVSVTSGISGYIDKMNILSVEEVSTVPLNDDYVNAFWKFDTGSGNTAYDSSGNDYDGTIYGASWTTDTPSGSGYALDFDGINDYMDLDSYSEYLGFNKTDDLIFSFYIKTNSNDKGMIYSLSHKWGTNPEFHIFLASNGSIGFMAEVTSCGFTLYSNGSYNDNIWHYVEIWYNGISSKPTTTMYIDDNFDGNITHWVCPFENTEFARTKIGRRSHNQSNYFDGKIDELKVIKYAGGNEQKPPEISGPPVGKKGEELDFTFVTNDPEEDDIWLWIDWGNDDVEDWFGPYESGEEVTRSQTYYENGTYTIRAKSKDVWDDSFSSYHTIRIGNAPPEPPQIAGPTDGDPEIEYEYTFNSTDYEGDNVSYFINWDDGNTEWTDYYESGEEVTVGHSWDEKGIYEITAKAKDNKDEGDWSDPYMVAIGNEAPGTPTINGPRLGETGVEYNYTFLTTDPEGDDVYYYIYWGDGNKTTDFGPHDSGEEITISHTWNKKGIYIIKARAKDIYGAFSENGTLGVIMPKNQITQSQSSIQKSLKTSSLFFFKNLNKNTIYSKILSKLFNGYDPILKTLSLY